MYHGITTALIVFAMSMPGIALADTHSSEDVYDSSEHTNQLDQQFLPDDSVYMDDTQMDDGTLNMQDRNVNDVHDDMLNGAQENMYEDVNGDMNKDVGDDMYQDMHNDLQQDNSLTVPTDDGVKDSLY